MTDLIHFQMTRIFRKPPVLTDTPGIMKSATGQIPRCITIFLSVFFLLAGHTGWSRDETDVAGAGYRIKFVYSGSVYLDAGSRSGLEVGQKLSVRRNTTELSTSPTGNVESLVGQVQIESVTAASAAGKVVFATSEIVAGDLAFPETEPSIPSELQANEDRSEKNSQTAALIGAPPSTAFQRKSSGSRLRETNIFRGRVGIDYSTLQVPGSDANSSQFGFMLRLDATRIGGTHWNIQGYHRGRWQSRTSSYRQETLTDLINRTYHLNVTYENPESNWVAGIGRLYVPWASNLNTIDGFYVGRKFGRQTAGIFLGTAPDPTSWDYSPDRRIGGAFYNVEGGSFDSVRYDSTAGIAVTWRQWRPDRQYGFFENNLFFKRYISIYSNIEADLLSGAMNDNRSEVVLSRSTFNVQVQPHERIRLNFNQNYFRNIPTFDTRLIGTGLLDEYLFQGFSGGFRLSLPYRVTVTGNAGSSSRTGDRKARWSYLGGVSISDILDSGIRLGVRFSQFDSSFGRGRYQSLSLSREIGEYVQFEVQGGQQNFKSIYTSQDKARFVHGTVDVFLRKGYFLGGGLTVYRGTVEDYNQIFLRLGYRFDNRHR